MGSISLSRNLILTIFFLGLINSLGAQIYLLVPEIERLERLTQDPAYRHGALVQLARLHQLSGDRERALQSWISAAYADPRTRDDWALLEAAKLMISIGEYDRAGAELRTILLGSNDQRTQEAASLLFAQLEAFRNRNTSALSYLLDFPIYSELQSRILYTLWRITEDTSWRTRLLNSYPQSPEAEIARDSIIAAYTPQWLLFPPRENLSSTPVQVLPAPQSALTTQERLGPNLQSPILQTGLFSREDNARAMAEKVANAGFQPQIIIRNVGVNEYWAVIVVPGSDINQSIRDLRNAGIESFPISVLD